MTTWTVFNVSGAMPREPTIIDSDQTLPAHGGHVGRISGSVLGCAVFFGVIVSIGIIVARDYYRKRLMRNDTSTLKNVTFPDDGVDNKTHTTVEDTNDGQPVMPSPTFCARSKASTDKTRTIENLPTDGGRVYENILKETVLEAKEIIYEDIVKTESETSESAVDTRQRFSEVSMSDPPYLSMEQNCLESGWSGAAPDGREDLYIHPIPDRHSVDTTVGGYAECSFNTI